MSSSNAHPHRDFLLIYDLDERRWRPAIVRARMTLLTRDGPVDVAVGRHEVTTEPDVLRFERVGDEGLVAVFEGWVRDEVWEQADIHTLLEDPVTARFKLWPVDRDTVRPGRQETPITVRYPKGGIHWETERDGRDAPIRIVGDGEDTTVITCWYEHVDLKTGTITVDETTNFSHWTDDLELRHVFGHAVGPEPWTTSADDRHNVTVWESREPLPPMPGHPGMARINTRKSGRMRIRAWPHAVTRRERYDDEGYALGAVESDVKPLAEAWVSVDVEAPKVSVRLVEPTEAVPADGSTHTLVFEFVRDDTGYPLKHGHISWVILADPDNPIGTVTPESHVLTPEAQGRVTVTYTSPKRWYRPGQRADDVFAFTRGTEDHLANVPVPLDPALRAKITARKVTPDIGVPVIAFDDTLLLDHAARHAPDVVRGTLRLRADTYKPPAEETTGIVHAAVDVVVFDGEGREFPLATPLTSERDGRFEWVIPELQRIHRTQVIVDTEPGRPRADLSPHSKQVIDAYERAVLRADWQQILTTMLDAEVLRRVNTQRLVLSRQLAQRPAHEAERAWTGTDLLGAVGWGAVTMYQGAEARWTAPYVGIYAQIDGFIVSAVQCLLAWTEIIDKLFEALGKMGGKLLTRFTPAITEGLRRAGRSLGRLMNDYPEIAPYVRPMWKSINDIMVAAGSGVGYDEQVRVAAREAYDGMFQFFRDKLSTVFGMLADTADQMAERTGSVLADWLKGYLTDAFNGLLAMFDEAIGGGPSGALAAARDRAHEIFRSCVDNMRVVATDAVGTASWAVESLSIPPDPNLDGYKSWVDELRRRNVEPDQLDRWFAEVQAGVDAWVAGVKELCEDLLLITLGASAVPLAVAKVYEIGEKFFLSLSYFIRAADNIYLLGQCMAEWGTVTKQLARGGQR